VSPTAKTERDRAHPVIECFGPTIQGEGALAGRPTHFVRFGGCDFTCSWCDSSHAVLPAEVRKAEKLTAHEIATRVAGLPGNPDWVTLSGGNPLLHPLNFLVMRLHGFGFKVAIETQGSRWGDWVQNVDLITISPKPPSSGMVNRDLDKFIAHLGGELIRPKVNLKVPIFSTEDLEFARRLHYKYFQFPFYLSVGTYMGGLYGDFDAGRIDTQDDIVNRYRWLVDHIVGDPDFRDVAVFPQLHALLWGHERGR